MQGFDDIEKIIDAQFERLRAPFVLAVRPGYRFANGWVTSERAIVVTVAADAAPSDLAALPDRLADVPIDVRRATPLKALQTRDPAAYVRSSAALRPEQQLAYFPAERLAAGGTLGDLVAAALAATAAKPKLTYVPPAGASLAPVTDTFTLLAHASPDAGWPNLKPFLAGTQNALTVAMYDCTSAHVLTALQGDLANKSLSLVLDHPAPNPTSDQTDEQTHAALVQSLGTGLHFAWALTGDDPFAAAEIFPTAYHIKVAVRDRAAFWLSSGNWNNSNQPDIDPVAAPSASASATARTCDRDWHAIVTHAGLSATFEAYIANDLAIASQHQAPATAAVPEAEAAFARAMFAAAAIPAAATPPFQRFFAARTFTDRMTITPLLTPDPGDYTDAILAIIRGAKTSFHMQTQYVHAPTSAAGAPLGDLIAAIAAKQKAGVDVRIITSEFETASYLEQLQAAGLDLSGVRIQNNVHNKGMVIDGAIAVVSSQNWSTDGVLLNRDAGLIIEHAGVAAYYEALFEHDWANLAKQATTA